jgi:hypothetical protein
MLTFSTGGYNIGRVVVDSSLNMKSLVVLPSMKMNEICFDSRRSGCFGHSWSAEAEKVKRASGWRSTLSRPLPSLPRDLGLLSIPIDPIT